MFAHGDAPRRKSGRAPPAFCLVSPADFQCILTLGLYRDRPLPECRDGTAALTGFAESPPLAFEQIPRAHQPVCLGIVRDRIFRRNVLRAYSERCAISGLRLINGCGRAEVTVADIRPVEANGPAIINNGIALSGTVHWMFHRGLITQTDELKVLISPAANACDVIRALINPSGYAHPPRNTSERPYPHFLEWHRRHRFKQ